MLQKSALFGTGIFFGVWAVELSMIWMMPGKKVEATSLTNMTVLGLTCTQATTFHENMPVDANHTGQFCVLINGQWQMGFLEEELESTKIFFVKQINDSGPAWQCGVRRGDILLELNGCVVQEMDF